MTQEEMDAIRDRLIVVLAESDGFRGERGTEGDTVYVQIGGGDFALTIEPI